MWSSFESIGKTLIEMEDNAGKFETLRILARDRYNALRENRDMRGLRDGFLDALGELRNYTQQTTVIECVCEILLAYLKDPFIIRRKYLNFLISGPAGTGKTSIAEAISKVLACSGMFIQNKMLKCGREHFIGEYEGQTVHRTKNHLLKGLDCGVIFVDEAYSLTPWDKGKPEGYGSEAASAICDFTHDYQGLYCLIVAGYEKQMRRYFLPANEGLSRRFPYKFVLESYSAHTLVRIFKVSLLGAMGIDKNAAAFDIKEADKFYNMEAFYLLEHVIELSMQGDIVIVPEEFDESTRKTYENVNEFHPYYPGMYQMFENQAGSMTNLADVAVTQILGGIVVPDESAAALVWKYNQRSLTSLAERGIVQNGHAEMKNLIYSYIDKISMGRANTCDAELQNMCSA